MKIKKEVKDIFIEFEREKIYSKRWKEIEYELIHKWKFTPFNLLAFWGANPVIEYNEENFDLVIEDDGYE